MTCLTIPPRPIALPVAIPSCCTTTTPPPPRCCGGGASRYAGKTLTVVQEIATNTGGERKTAIMPWIGAYFAGTIVTELFNPPATPSCPGALGAFLSQSSTPGAEFFDCNMTVGGPVYSLGAFLQPSNFICDPPIPNECATYGQYTICTASYISDCFSITALYDQCIRYCSDDTIKSGSRFSLTATIA